MQTRATVRSSSLGGAGLGQIDALDWFQLAERFEDMAEAICDAGRYGTEPHHQVKFEKGQMVFLPYYQKYHRVLEEYTPPSNQGDDPALDPWLTFTENPSLSSLIQDDSGFLIERIMRCREAIHACSAPNP